MSAFFLLAMIFSSSFHHSLSQKSSTTSSTESEYDSFISSPRSQLCDPLDENSIGMESGRIKDSEISASSSYNEQSVGSQFSRLNIDQSGGAWCPSPQLDSTHSGTEWIQVNLTQRFIITAVSTQGRFGNGLGVEFVEEFWIEYSRDAGISWHKWKNRKGSHMLRGNQDSYSIKKNSLDLPIVGANMVRIVPYSQYMRTVCLRFELHGCPFKDGPISYQMPDGAFGGKFGDLIDDSFDGFRSQSGFLSGGLGQMFDGIKGRENYKINQGYEWVGWRASNETIDLEFTFDSVRNFTRATFYVHNMFRKSIEVFSSALVSFSFDGKRWSQNSLEFDYMPDHAIEEPRDVVIHLHHKVGQHIRFQLKFAAKWLLISEVTFESAPVPRDYVANLNDLESAPSTNRRNVRTRVTGKASSISSISLFLGIGFLAIALSGVVMMLIYRYISRHRQLKKQPNNFYSVDRSCGLYMHEPTVIGENGSTPVYCDPDQFRRIPGQTLNVKQVTKVFDHTNHYGHYGVSRTRHDMMQHQGIPMDHTSEHEYAVPDVVYKDNPLVTTRLIMNPFQQEEVLVKSGGGSTINSSKSSGSSMGHGSKRLMHESNTGSTTTYSFEMPYNENIPSFHKMVRDPL